MSYRTYAFVATPAEVASNAFRRPLATLFPAVCERHVVPTHLLVLAALLGGRDLSALAQERGSFVVFSRAATKWFPLERDLGAQWGCEPGDCPVVLRVPPGFTRQLARLNDEQIRRSGRAWASTPWWGMDGALTPRQAARLIFYLRTLARLAARAHEGRALYLWRGEE
jgi:hypothetical protein